MSTVTIRPPVDATELPVVDTVEDTESGIEADKAVDVFPQSVASGGPTPTGIILWTRINPEYYAPSQSLRLEVATDDSFQDFVIQTELPGPGVKPTDNYTVRVDLKELLNPDTFYYYRFSYRSVRSQTGRCRTLPAEGASPESLQFGVLNCHNYQEGYFGALAYLADMDVDFVLHLGDYIYEDIADTPYEDRGIDLPDGETHPMSLNDFRHIYETYKADPFLRKLHEHHTVIQTWDDHAIANDRYWDYEADAPVFPDHPCGDIPDFTRYLTRAGIQAWWEFIPARITYNPKADHIHDSFKLYNAIQYGDLVTLLLTDDRLFRSRPRSRLKQLSPLKHADPSRTMLGTTQRDWFLTELQESETQWTVWANSVLFKPFSLFRMGRITLTWEDSWNGFEAERAEILEALSDVRRQRETTFVTLTGDMHMTLATLLQNEDESATPVGAEFMTPSVTSMNLSEKISQKLKKLAVEYSEFVNPSVGLNEKGEAIVESICDRISNLFIRLLIDCSFVDSSNWGFSVVEFSRDACTWDVYWVDKTVNSAEAECRPVYRVRLPAGKYAIQERHTEVPDSI